VFFLYRIHTDALFELSSFSVEALTLLAPTHSMPSPNVPLFPHALSLFLSVNARRQGIDPYMGIKLILA